LNRDVLLMLTKNRKVVVFLGVFLIAAALNAWFYHFMLEPVSGRTAAVEGRLTEARQRVVMLGDAIERYENYDKSRQQVAEFKELLPSSGEYTEVLRKMYDLADKRGIQEARFTVSSKDAFGEMEMITFTLPVAGNYKDIRLFIHDVETSDLFLNIGNLTLSKASKGNQISLGIGLSTYVRR